MLFLWTTTKHGKIWLDGEGFKQIVSKRLPKSYYCQEIAFVGEKNLINIHITAPETSTDEQKAFFEKKFFNIFNPSGISTQVIWLNVAPQDNPSFTPIWMLPFFWAGVAATFAALINLGFKGILWSFFALIVGYVISWILLTEDGQKKISSLTKRIWR